MCLLFETILIQGKKLHNIEYHNERFNNSRKNYFHCSDRLKLEDYIPVNVEDSGAYRCKVTYNSNIQEVEIIPYVYTPIRSLQLVICNTIDYSYKYLNREIFSQLKQDSIAEDILIVKNGLITDTSIANIIVKKGDQWFTPSLPLLKGTQREKLIAEQKVKVQEIRLTDLFSYEKFGLINALRTFENIEEIDISHILF